MLIVAAQASLFGLTETNIDHLVELGYQYGPFLFAFVFLFWIVRWAQAKFEAIRTQKPSAKPEDLRAYRSVYLVSFAFGVSLVIVSVVWWWRYRPTMYVYQGVIEDLDETQTLDAETAYFRAKRVPPAMTDVPQQRDEKFVVLQALPFRPTDTVEMLFSKNGGTGKSLHRLHVPYSTSPEPHFGVVWNQNGNRYEIQPLTDRVTRRWDLGVVVEAREPSTPREQRPATLDSGRQIAAARSSLANVVPTLQQERVPVGAKIEALDQLNALSPAAIAEQARTVTRKEPVAVTLLDLSRHTDPELASKAAAALRNLDVENYTTTLLASPMASTRTVGESILFRMENAMALRVLGRLNAAEPKRSTELSQRLAREGGVALKPTGSAQGDRYYLQATWDARDASAVTCLTSLFNNGMGAVRTSADEAALMAQRSQRLVYGADKEWTVWMAEESRRCGAKTEFVSIKPTARK